MTDSLRARYEALLEVSDSIASHQSLPALFHALTPCLAKLVSFAGLGLMLYDQERRVTKLYILESSVAHRMPVEHEFPAGQTPTSLVLETGQPLYFPDIESETRFPVVMRILLQGGVRSYCV